MSKVSPHALPNITLNPAPPNLLREASHLPNSDSSISGSMIQQFVLQTLDMLGAALEGVEWGVYDVLLPQEKVRRITFDVEIAQERVDCELVTFGTPFLESMIQAARHRGRLQVRRIQTRVEPPSANLEEKLSSLVHFVKCKPPKAVRWWREEGLFLLCSFHVKFQADEMVENIVSVLTDTHSLAEVTSLLPSLESHWFTSGPVSETGPGSDGSEEEAFFQSGPGGSATPLRVSIPFSFENVFTQAAKAVQPEVRKRIENIASQNRSQLRDELEKSRHYYETTLRTLERQVKNSTDAVRLERLNQKIEATKRDKEHRIEDISRAYDVSADLRLDQAILYRAPVVCVETQIQQRTDLFPFVFRYYPWAAKWSPIVCPLCHEATSRLQRGATSWHCGCESTRG